MASFGIKQEKGGQVKKFRQKKGGRKYLENIFAHVVMAALAKAWLLLPLWS